MAEIAVREGGGAGRGVGVGGGGAGASAEELRLSRVVARRAIVSALYEAQDGGDGDACEREGSDDEDEDEGVEAAETEAEAAETEAEAVACGGAGLVARAVSPQPGEMVLRLMGAITPEAVSVETICVINAALVHYHIAQAQGRRRALVRRVWERALAAEAEAEVAEEEEGVGKGGADKEGDDPAAETGAHADDHDAPRAPPSPPKVLKSFVRLLGFWRSIYVTHRSERTFLEYSSGVPFQRWRALVATLKKELETPPPGLVAAPPGMRRARDAAASTTTSRCQPCDASD